MKIDDIRPIDAMAGQRAAMQADIEWLNAQSARFVTAPCPACDADEARSLYEKYGMRHVICGRCQTQYVNPRPGPDLLAEFYARSANYAYWAKHIFPASAEARRIKLFRPRAQVVAELARTSGVSSGTLIEVGAGYGQFCDEIKTIGIFERVIAIEPTPHLAEACRALGLETICAPYEQVTIDGKADVVACFEVIEHLFAPKDFLQWSHTILRPDGILFLTCPNSAGFETLLLGKASGAVDHEHLNLFTPESLALLAERQGFRGIDVTTPGELDVELVQQALDAGDVLENELGPVLKRLISRADRSKLQEVIRDAKLSSNMRLVAHR
jgi:SAM-dependent methyltransferase